MKRLIASALLLCAALAGCADQQQHVQQTGKPINLSPTTREDAALAPWERSP